MFQKFVKNQTILPANLQVNSKVSFICSILSQNGFFQISCRRSKFKNSDWCCKFMFEREPEKKQTVSHTLPVFYSRQRIKLTREALINQFYKQRMISYVLKLKKFSFEKK